jgi:hypothetical protein
MLRLCPFGHILRAYQKESVWLDFSLYLFIGKHSKETAFSHKKLGALCTFLPYGDDYTQYEWPIDHQKVIIFDTGGMLSKTIKMLCYHLVSEFNPAVLFTYSEVLPNQIYLSKKEMSND